MRWRRKWQPAPVFLPGESQGRGSLMGCRHGVAQSQIRLKRLSSSSSRDGAEGPGLAWPVEVSVLACWGTRPQRPESWVDRSQVVGVDQMPGFRSCFLTDLKGRFLVVCMCVLSSVSVFATSCTVCSLAGSSARGTFQARILEGNALSSCRGSSQPRNRTRVSCVSCIGKWIVYHQHYVGSQSSW